MTAKILVFLNHKGGCGKTTACMSLSAELANRGHRVLVVDADAQQTATSWSHAAPDASPFPAAVVNLASYEEKMHREIQRQLENYDFIVIDCPPSLSAVTPHSALLIANLVLVPVPAAPADLWAARSVKKLIERVQIVNPDLRAAILANKIQRTSLSKAVMNELSNFGIPLMKSQLSNRTAYQEAILSGTTVSALGWHAKAAAIEVRAMTDEVLEILGDAK